MAIEDIQVLLLQEAEAITVNAWLGHHGRDVPCSRGT
jgi:hypothetical protein